jgi:hypothetical protein
MICSTVIDPMIELAVASAKIRPLTPTSFSDREEPAVGVDYDASIVARP